MKKILSFLLVLLLIFPFAGCKKEEKPSVLNDTINTDEQEDLEDWRKVLNKYDVWADNFAKFIDDYSKKQTDSELSKEYTLKLSNYEEWKKIVNKLSKKVMLTKDANKYSEKLSSINKKIAKANNKLKTDTESK